MVLLCQIKPLVILCIVVNTRDVSRNAQYEDVNGTIFAARKRSWAKLCFLHVSVILSTGGGGRGVCREVSVKWGSLLMRVSVKVGSLSDTPRDKDPPLDRTPPRTKIPRRNTPYGGRAGGTHPTGMLPCLGN